MRKFIILILAFLALPIFAKEPTNIMIGFGIGAGQSKLSIQHSHAAKFPMQSADTTGPNVGGTLWAKHYDSSTSSWALAWEFLVGYKHFLNDYVGFRYYANVGIQHYKPTLFESKTEPIGLIDYTLNADLLINFWESDRFAVGAFGGLGFGGTSFDKKAMTKYMAIYDRATGRPIGLANVNQHFFNVNASVGARMVFFQKVRHTGARVCDKFIKGKRVCRVPVFYIGHSIEFSAKFPLMDYIATPLPDMIQVNGAWVSRPRYVVSNPYRLTVRYVIDF